MVFIYVEMDYDALCQYRNGAESFFTDYEIENFILRTSM